MSQYVRIPPKNMVRRATRADIYHVADGLNPGFNKINNRSIKNYYNARNSGIFSNSVVDDILHHQIIAERSPERLDDASKRLGGIVDIDAVRDQIETVDNHSKYDFIVYTAEFYNQGKEFRTYIMAEPYLYRSYVRGTIYGFDGDFDYDHDGYYYRNVRAGRPLYNNSPSSVFVDDRKAETGLDMPIDKRLVVERLWSLAIMCWRKKGVDLTDPRLTYSSCNEIPYQELPKYNPYHLIPDFARPQW